MTAIFGLFNIIPGWLYAACLAAALATNCATIHQRDTARVELSNLRASHAEAARAAEASARTKEQEFNTALTVTEQKASDEKKRLSVALAAANRELRNRPERPSGGDLSKSPVSGLGCTGAGLFAEDARVALGEAARADGVRLQLEACKAKYNEAVKLTAP